jgi:hypothetical protein
MGEPVGTNGRRLGTAFGLIDLLVLDADADAQSFSLVQQCQLCHKVVVAHRITINECDIATIGHELGEVDATIVRDHLTAHGVRFTRRA